MRVLELVSRGFCCVAFKMSVCVQQHTYKRYISALC